MSEPERFRKTLFGGGAVSTGGYRVFFNSRSRVEYIDGSTRIYVSAEGLAGKKVMAIYPDDMRVGSIDGKLISDAIFRERIFQRVRRAGTFLGWTFQ
jgi:hypothetical protein